jgi:sugar phosphate isomerase/epimerase
MKLGLQLYTVRDALTADFNATLEAISKMDFDGVELAGNYGGMEPAALKKHLNELGLDVAGMHIGLEALETDLEAQLHFAHAVGAKHVVCPWLDSARYASSWEGVIESLAKVGRILEGEGVGFAYHNHTFEFETRVGSGYALDAIAAAGIPLEFDIAWAHASGVNPATYLTQHSGHVPLLHVKDVRRVNDKPGTDGWETVELGRGSVPLRATLEVAEAADVQWLVLEQDHSAGDALDSVRQSRAWYEANKVV